MEGWRPGGRLRTTCFLAGALAGLAMIVVGCQTLTQGSASYDRSDAATYRASVSSSAASSSSRSAVRESEAQASKSAEAVHTSCDELSTTSVNAVDAVNAFIDAFNEGASDLDPKAGAAVDALDASADRVTASLSEPLSDELEGALRAYVDATRNVSTAISAGSGMDEFNAATDRLNVVKTTALDLCDAEY